MKKKDIVLLVVLFFIIVLLFVLFINKSFFRDYYVNSDNEKIYVPRYSFFISDDDDLTFYSLRYESDLSDSIDKFTDECNDCGYKIFTYFIEDKGFIRKIVVKYKKN